MSRTPQEEANLALVVAMFENVLVPLDSARVDEYIAADYIQHHQNVEPGREALKSFLDWASSQPGEAEQILHRAFVDGDHVTLHYHVIRHAGDAGLRGDGHLPRGRRQDRRALGRDAGCRSRPPQPAVAILRKPT